MGAALAVPALFCPFPSRVSAHAEEADGHTLDWLSEQNLLSAQDYDRFRNYRCGWLAARAYPNADLDRLLLASDWIGWLCALDNHCDESGLGTRPAQLTRVLARLGEIVLSPTPRADDYDGPLEAGLADLLQRMSAWSSPAWRKEFAHHVDVFFDALVWESSIRAQGSGPTLEEYLEMRPRSSAMDHCVDLIALIEGMEAPAALRASAPFDALRAKAINVVCWANDLVSLERELDSGVAQNLVLVVQRDRGCPLEVAQQVVVEMHDAEVRSFIDVQAQATADAPLDEATEAYLLGLRCWMRGNLEWSHETARYRAEDWNDQGREQLSNRTQNRRDV
jgi:hypothetical protein